MTKINIVRDTYFRRYTEILAYLHEFVYQPSVPVMEWIFWAPTEELPPADKKPAPGQTGNLTYVEPEKRARYSYLSRYSI